MNEIDELLARLDRWKHDKSIPISINGMMDDCEAAAAMIRKLRAQERGTIEQCAQIVENSGMKDCHIMAEIIRTKMRAMLAAAPKERK